MWSIPDGPLIAGNGKEMQTVCEPSTSTVFMWTTNWWMVTGPIFFFSMELMIKTLLEFHRIPTVSLWGVSLLILEQGG